jgi:sialidase-1
MGMVCLGPFVGMDDCLMVASELLAEDALVAVEADIAIADGPVKMHRAWPALQITVDGELVVTYKESTDHNRTDDGGLVVARSSDGGQSWTDKRMVAAEPGWGTITNHGATRLSDGTLLLNMIRSRHYRTADGKDYRYARSSFSRSSDGGRSWQLRGEDLTLPYADPLRTMASYGRILELEDGRLIAPVFGIPKEMEDGKLRVLGMMFSPDGGQSWPESTLVYADRQGDICPSETDIIRLPDGRILAIIRANAAKRLYRSYSADEGQTWSPIEATEMPGQCPCLIYLASGALLCAYRDMRPEQAGMSCAISEDMGQSWQPLGYLYKGANFDCAYPAMATLPDGRIYCAYYKTA